MILNRHTLYWFFAVAASQHLHSRRIFPKSAGVARKSPEVTGLNPDLFYRIRVFACAVVKSCFCKQICVNL